MKTLTVALLCMLMTTLTSAKVLTDKSKQFQYELPDSFKEKAIGNQTSFVSPDGKIVVTSNLIPNKQKLRLGELMNGYARLQDNAGKLYVRSGSVTLGGTEGMALEVKDKKENHTVSLATLNPKGLAVVVISFKAPIVAEPALFTQLVARSFRWLIK
ncbi:hypothetical protein JST97_14305 [bacterium]|nr:hypothetical protein [bacterium]